jgi:DNA-binding NtrC family response regulator
MSVVERRHASAVLAALNGNKVQAAKILGIHRATLARLLQEEGRAGARRDAETDASAAPPSRNVG